MGRLNWGGLLLGAIAGLGTAAALAIVLFAIGLRLGDSAAADGAFALIQLAGLVVAGYVGGRFTTGGPATRSAHGAIAALGLFAVSAVIGLAAGQDIGTLAIVGGGVVALVLGSVGGTLAARR